MRDMRPGSCQAVIAPRPARRETQQWMGSGLLAAAALVLLSGALVSGAEGHQKGIAPLSRLRGGMGKRTVPDDDDDE